MAEVQDGMAARQWSWVQPGLCMCSHSPHSYRSTSILIIIHLRLKKKVFWGNLCLLHEAACSAEGVLLSNFTSMRSWGLNLIALPFFLTDASQMGDVYILTLLANGKQRARTVKVGSHQKMQRILQKLKSLSPYFFLHLYLDISKCERFPISVKP